MDDINLYFNHIAKNPFKGSRVATFRSQLHSLLLQTSYWNNINTIFKTAIGMFPVAVNIILKAGAFIRAVSIWLAGPKPNAVLLPQWMDHQNSA